MLHFRLHLLPDMQNSNF